jgi:hypothetical protein
MPFIFFHFKPEEMFHNCDLATCSSTRCILDVSSRQGLDISDEQIMYSTWTETSRILNDVYEFRCTQTLFNKEPVFWIELRIIKLLAQLKML